VRAPGVLGDLRADLSPDGHKVAPERRLLGAERSGRVAAVLASRVCELSAGPRPARPEEARLTAREREIVELVAAGLSNKEISQLLTIELATVKNHVHIILAKLGVSRRSEVAARIRRRLPSRNGGSEVALLRS
jgi:DNA-binding NarL/FixJ family response regulator